MLYHCCRHYHRHDELPVHVVTDMRPMSSFASDPSQAGRELRSCLDTAKHSVPELQYSSTPIFLGATAGMRLLRYALRLFLQKVSNFKLSVTAENLNF